MLIAHYRSAQQAIHAKESEVAQLKGFNDNVLEGWGNWDTGRQELDTATKAGIEIISYTSSRYPENLKTIADFPIILYVKGKLTRNDVRSIAIVGTRTPSEQGKKNAEKLAEDLSAMGYTIISGLARGVDSQAHRGAMKKGRTLAVLGTGLQHIYPKEHQSLAEQIVEHGALISEYPMWARPDKHSFIVRNRIVSGLAIGVVCVEAYHEKSGTMSTMRLARKQKKKTFVLSTESDGNKLLLARNEARLVHNAGDITDTLADLFIQDTDNEHGYSNRDKSPCYEINCFVNEGTT
ncbi:MAG: DNA-protecting protein DprA [Chlamydiales bacterium]|nr:DNA-processing protein DprA [Chlamydiia bacterium]MCP5507865.1 DNA-protecting protein DprA [Chlamydiales bacterium]